MTSTVYGRYGISTVMKNLALNLVEQGNEVTIGAFFFSEKTPDGVRQQKLSSIGNLLKLNKKYDIVHSHTPATNFLVAFFRGPFLYEYYGSPNTRMNLGRVNLEISLKMICALKKKVLAISNMAADDLLARNKKFDVEVIPLGVDLNRFSHENIKKYKHGKPHLLFAGRTYPHKRVNELISVMDDLCEIYPKVYLQIIGSGSELSNLKNQVLELGLSENVGFSGWVSDYELPIHYSSCDVYVTASAWEMFGLPLIEAMACGKPVVASDIPAHSELIHKSNAGILYRMGDKKDLVKKICKAYEEREVYRDLGLLFAKNNEWSVVVDHVSKVYVQMLNRKRVTAK